MSTHGDEAAAGRAVSDGAGGVFRIMGIDPGLATGGFGVVDQVMPGRVLECVACGEFKSKPDVALPERLARLAAWLREALDAHQPHAVAVEEMFFALNVRTAVQMAHGRGVVLLVAAERGLPVHEYSALSIKQSVAGYGRATKEQVQAMVMRSLKLAAAPSSDHASDALAVALCHAASRRHPAMAQLIEARAESMGQNSRRRGRSAWRRFKPGGEG